MAGAVLGFLHATMHDGVLEVIHDEGRSYAMVRDPIAETRVLSAAVGAWLKELLWNAAPGNGVPPERFLEDLLRERRQMFQTAGLFDALPWKLFV